LRELSALVWRSRLTTLCGPAGAGKTRLAVALAQAVQADFIDGAWWVDLSVIVDPGSVGQSIAAAVLPGERATDVASETIGRRFAATALLVLDNCEQVVDGCAQVVTELLGRTQSLRMIATSREPLGVPGEQVWRVPGLRFADLPDAFEQDRDSPAVELFMERARESTRSFDPGGPGVREAVARICRLLDGMPLSIELAAARVPVLGVAGIAERLEHGSEFLGRAARGAPQRHRTLRDTLEWSHRLLDKREKRLFRRLGVFKGSFSLAAAEAIGADEALPADWVLDVLSALVDRSMVQVVEDRGDPRYRLLVTIRHFALGKLDDSGESAAIRQSHAAYFYRSVQNAEPRIAGVAGPDQQIRVFEELELEHDNLHEALRWLLASSAPNAAHLSSMLWPFWYQRGYYREARETFERLLASGQEMPTAARAEAFREAGDVAFFQCDYEVAAEHLKSALGLSLQLDDRLTAALALQRLGSIAREQGGYGEARELHSQSLAIWSELGEQGGIAASNNYLGFVAWLIGDHQIAEALCLEALAWFRPAGNLQETAETLVNLGANALYNDQLDIAGDRLEEALDIARRLGFQEGIAWSLHELAILDRRRHRPPGKSSVMLRDALLLHSQLGDRWRVASVLEEIAGSVLLQADPRLAVEVLGHAELLRERIRSPIPPVEAPARAAALSRLQAKLSRDSFTAAWSEGRELQLAQAVDRALSTIEQLDQSPTGAPGQRSTAILTPRELAVLELLGNGLTNREIAASLYMSSSTAGVHVSNILRKLGAKRRVDATALAHSLGLLPIR
jgi:predicted ATPase/DNA-binding CsgD family transcriptional regulator